MIVFSPEYSLKPKVKPSVKIGKMERDTANLNKQIKKLDKYNIKKLELQLQQKTDSIILLTDMLSDTIRAKDKKIASINQESEGTVKESFTRTTKCI